MNTSVARAALLVGGFSTEDTNAILKELMKAKNMLAKGQLI